MLPTGVSGSSAYSLADVARICRVSRSRLRYWERTELVVRGEAPGFEFRDLVGVRRLVGLLERGVPLRSIRRSVEVLRHRMPEVDRPLEALRVCPEGSGRVVVRHEGLLVEPDGQTVLDFGVAAVTCVSVAPIGARRDLRSDARRVLDQLTAADWFERGCKLDTDRATWADAVEAYRRALELDPGFADAHCNLGSIYYNQERKSQARACFRQALEVDAGHVEANLNLATLLEEEGRHESALRHYKCAIETDPFYADAHVSLALLYEKLSLRRTAREHWRRYLQLDPAGAWVDVARRHLDS
jgi:tetratricopeptide (TPR) repeat protein